MKKMRNGFLGLLIVTLLLLTIGCPTTVEPAPSEPAPTAVTFISAQQAGGTSGTANSTSLILTFSVDPTTLTADDITVTGATKGALTGTGTTRSLVISGITVANGETVSVAIANPSGYTLTGSPKTAVVYRKIVNITYNAGTGNTSGTVPVGATAYASGATVTVLDNTGNLVGANVVSDIKQRFIGWHTDSVATTALYTAGNTFSITENTTLYAIYTTGTDVLRKVGPAGGLIFYDAGSTQSWGRYLEAAPKSTEWPSKQWGKFGTLVNGTGTAIGTGKKNTALIVAVLNAPAAETDRAAQLADALSHGGKDDWFLPSKDELYEMCWVLHSRRYRSYSAEDNPVYGRSRVGGFAGYYWSSSEDGSSDAWQQLFSFGYQLTTNKTYDTRVRAVRAF